MTRILWFLILLSIFFLLLVPGVWWLSDYLHAYWPSQWAFPPLQQDFLLCLPNSFLKTDYWWRCVDASERYNFSNGLLISQKVVILASSLIVVSVFFLTTTSNKKSVIVRGRKLFIGTAKLKKTLKKIKGPREIEMLKGIKLPAALTVRHWLLSGAVGAGKTVFIRNILTQFIKLQQRCLVLDVKGDFIGDLYWSENNGHNYEAWILNPFDKRSVQWFLGYDITNIDDAREFSRMFLSSTGSDSFWNKASANVMVAVIRSLQVEKGKEWSWAELAERINAPVEQLLQWAEAHYSPAAQILENRENETSASILVNFATDFAAISDIARYWHANHETYKISLRSWLDNKDRCKTLIIGWDASRATASKSWAGAFIDLAGMYISSPQFQNSGRINIVLDEFAQLPKMKGIVQALDIGRSKGVGVLIGVQSFHQLLDTYGQRANSFRSLISNHIFAQMSAGKDAEDASRFLGEQTICGKQLSISSNDNSRTISESWREKQSPLMTPNEFSSMLGPDRKGVRILYTSLDLNDAYLLHFPYPEIKQHREAFVPAEPVDIIYNQDKSVDKNEHSEGDKRKKSNPFEKLLDKKSQ